MKKLLIILSSAVVACGGERSKPSVSTSTDPTPAAAVANDPTQAPAPTPVAFQSEQTASASSGEAISLTSPLPACAQHKLELQYVSSSGLVGLTSLDLAKQTGATNLQLLKVTSYSAPAYQPTAATLSSTAQGWKIQNSCVIFGATLASENTDGVAQFSAISLPSCTHRFILQPIINSQFPAVYYVTSGALSADGGFDLTAQRVRLTAHEFEQKVDPVSPQYCLPATGTWTHLHHLIL